MLFSSTIFIFIFLPIVLFCYYKVFANSRNKQNILLLFASLFFYAWGEPWFVLVMILSIFVNWFLGILVDKYRNCLTISKIILLTTLVFNLIIMFIFKYLMFTLNTLNSLFGVKLSVPIVILPIGISFFTFQAMSYVIDVYREDGKVQRNPLNVGLYIAFFPQLIAGPIVRYQTIADQMLHRKETFDDFAEGVSRFIIGLGKKVLLANTMAIIVDQAFLMQVDELSFGFAWVGAVAYSFQIFFDFSGYSDMGIGLGKMFGFHFLENFNYPYISISISEFWRRWHISLGTWFRDYVYIPMGGNRVKKRGRLIFNLFIVWFLTGLWHGANWTFIVWGIMYFILLSTERFIDYDKNIKNNIIKRIYTLFFVQIGWVIFRSDSLSQALQYIKTMLHLGNNKKLVDNNVRLYFYDNRYFFLLAVVFAMPTMEWLSKKINCKDNIIIDICFSLIYIFIFLVSVSYILKGSYNPFIYFNF